MPERTHAQPNGKMPDLIRFIKSIQRLEGDSDCFGTGKEACRPDCLWREYCLEEMRRDEIKTGGNYASLFKQSLKKQNHQFLRRQEMTTATTGQKRKNRKVTFSIEAPEAKEVGLMGDFNGWNPKKHPMKKNGDGIWKKTVILPSNIYEYKFLIDGEWKEDPSNDKTCPNRFGSFNSVLNVSPP